ncbi:putative ABC transport system substrate-binding protein [Bradyrhizobium lablabi]|uniref:Putative ABC transport system substrate-binding protein n=2 Tax=Bradyrhizobium lablabi TaxID=722472 RepID=A0A1M6WY88_9BRAD|nr:putative ABC transport system substrate-binding protein [Bradyrhizobium lablabi]
MRVKRRTFIAAVGGAAAWPLAARAQQAGAMRRVGVLMVESDPVGQLHLKLFVQKLQELGWTDGRNIHIEVRLTGTDAERIQKFAKELVAWQPDVIATNSTPGTAAVQRETRMIPTVFVVVSDPVGEGFVASLARPGGNITGFINYEASIAGKWVDLLKEIDPRLVRAAGLFNPDAAPGGGSFFLRPFEAAARSLAITPLATPVRSDADIEAAIAALSSEPGGGLVMMADSFMGSHRARLIEQAARHKVLAVYPFRSASADGGLLSYGPDFSDLYLQQGLYVDRILRGAKPNELPVQVPTKFELVVNLRTAKALGLELPATLLGRADEVIE